MSYELYHYGVKGMKWGIRRYQNSDGSLTTEGRKRAKTEYKQDNKTAFKLGKNATLYGHAAARSTNRTIKIENKLDKQYDNDPQGLRRKTQKLRKKWDASAKTTMELTQQYMHYKDKAEKHCQSLIDKYGDEAVSNIRYKDVKLTKGKYSPSSFKVMNEKTVSKLDRLAAVGNSIVGSSVLSTLLGGPAMYLTFPKETEQHAREIETVAYRRNLRSR